MIIFSCYFWVFIQLEYMNGLYSRILICVFFNNALATAVGLPSLIRHAHLNYYEFLACFPNPPPANMVDWLSEYEVVKTARSEAVDAIRQVVKKVREARYGNRRDLNAEAAFMNNQCYNKVPDWRNQNSTV